jgi:hypothetical protein
MNRKIKTIGVKQKWEKNKTVPSGGIETNIIPNSTQQQLNSLYGIFFFVSFFLKSWG